MDTKFSRGDIISPEGREYLEYLVLGYEGISCVLVLLKDDGLEDAVGWKVGSIGTPDADIVEYVSILVRRATDAEMVLYG